MCLKNKNDKGLFNGMQGGITKLYKKPKNKLEFYANNIYFEVLFDPKQFNREKYDFGHDKSDPVPFDYAYCITAHKCVHPQTLIETMDGIIEIQNASETGMVYTPDGYAKYKKTPMNPIGPAIHVRVETGHDIIVTPDHRVEVWDGKSYVMSEARNLLIGDFLRLKTGGNSFNRGAVQLPPYPKGDVRAIIPRHIPFLNTDIAEFFGLMVADGTVYKSGFRLLKRQEDLSTRFKQLVIDLFGVNPIEYKKFQKMISEN
jgi:hypothetical protein